MNTKNLFKVLVIGGAALAGPSIYAQDGLPKTFEPAQEIREVFCAADNTEVCEVTVVNNQCQVAPKAGLHCCWGTSCE